MKTSSRFSTQILMFLIQKYCFIIAFSVQQSRSRRKWVGNMASSCQRRAGAVCSVFVRSRPGSGLRELCCCASPCPAGHSQACSRWQPRIARTGGCGAILAAPCAHFSEGRLRPEDRAGSGRVGPGLGVVLGHSRELSVTPEGRTSPQGTQWVCGVTGSVGVREWSWM